MVSTVEKVFKLIVDDYKAGNISKEQGLNEAESKYKSSLIDIKQELHENFEIFCFYRYAPCDIDEYIMACDRSVNSPSSTERDHFAQVIDRIIKGVEADCKDTLEEGESFHTALNTVYMEVDKIRDLCRKNREISELYEKYKAEIEGLKNETVPSESTPLKTQSASNKKISILDELVEVGQLYFEEGKYISYKSMPQFIEWCSTNGYIDAGDKKDKYQDILTPNLIYHKIKNNCSLETLKRYFRSIKETRGRKK
jgi:hypothetical protein